MGSRGLNRRGEFHQLPFPESGTVEISGIFSPCRNDNSYKDGEWLGIISVAETAESLGSYQLCLLGSLKMFGLTNRWHQLYKL